MSTPTPSEQERYRYLMLKKKQVVGSEDIKEQPKPQGAMGTLSSLLRGVMRNAPIEQIQTLQHMSKSPENPNESPQEYENRVIQPREQAIASEGVGRQLEPLIQAGTAMGGEGIALAGVKALKPLFKWESSLKQAEKAKVGLDSLRNNLGKAKELALLNTGDIPAEVNWAGNMSQKVINAIKNPVYQVEFTPEGGVVQNIRNLDKMKLALNDIVTTKDFVEGGNLEKRQIMQFAGRLRDSMVKAADDAGNPELGQSLKNYHNFMEKYNKINDNLVDKYGDAMANKLKASFKITAEPKIKEAWKEVSKTSPEIKSIMKSMNNRELLNNLLKVGGAVGAAHLGKKYITGD